MVHPQRLQPSRRVADPTWSEHPRLARSAVRGRTSGAWRTTPVNLLDHRGRRYLVSARGEGQWVRNLRVAGTAAMGVRSLSVDLAGRPRRNALARGAAPVTVP
jgi:hypothetical protein